MVFYIVTQVIIVTSQSSHRENDEICECRMRVGLLKHSGWLRYVYTAICELCIENSLPPRGYWNNSQFVVYTTRGNKILFSKLMLVKWIVQ